MGVGLFISGTYESDKHPEDWLESVGAWFESHEEEPLMMCDFGQNEAEQPTLFLQIHPCAEDVEISVPQPGICLVNAKTSTAGPGYHIYLCDLLRALGEHHGIEWETPDDDVEGDETGYFFQHDASAVRQEMLRWLSAMSRVVVEHCKETECAGQQMVSMPLDRRYPDQKGILTPMGPRTVAWFEEMIEAPEQGTEFFPWWSEGVAADFFLGRAVCRLWQVMRWRPPVTDEEAELVMDVHLDLERAFHLDPNVNMPWREWREIIEYLTEYFGYAEFQNEDTQEDEIIVRASKVNGQAPLIGYRRGRVNVTLSGGWSLTIPGSFAEAWDENGESWTAWLGGRKLVFKPWSVCGPNDEALGPQEILDSLPWPTGSSLIDHEDGELLGRAVFAPTEEEGEQGWQLKACTAAAGKFAECNVYVESESDLDWALETWKSLRS